MAASGKQAAELPPGRRNGGLSSGESEDEVERDPRGSLDDRLSMGSLDDQLAGRRNVPEGARPAMNGTSPCG